MGYLTIHPNQISLPHRMHPPGNTHKALATYTVYQFMAGKMIAFHMMIRPSQ